MYQLKSRWKIKRNYYKISSVFLTLKFKLLKYEQNTRLITNFR